MRLPRGTQPIEVRAVKGLVTNVDLPDLPENYALRTKGFRYTPEGTLGVRDFGTQHRFASYPSGLTGLTFVGGYTFFDQNAGEDRDFVLAVDSIGSTHLFIHNGSAWVELTERYRGIISLVSGREITLEALNSDIGLTDDCNSVDQIAADQLNGWIVVNTDTGESAIVTDTAASAEPATYVVLTLNVNVDAAYADWDVGETVNIYRNTVTHAGWTMDNGAAPHNRWTEVANQLKVNLYYGNSSTPPTANKPVQAMRYTAARSYFQSATSGFTLPAGWHLQEGGGGLLPEYEASGSNSSPVSEGWTTKTGNVSVYGGSGSVILQGSGTAFLTEYTVGAFIKIEPGVSEQVRRIVGIASNTELTVDSAFTEPASEPVTHQISNGHLSASKAVVADGHGVDWLKISTSVRDVVATDADTYLFRLAVIAEVNGYQYSDPIYKAFVTSGSGDFGNIGLTFEVEAGMCPKNISALCVYLAKTITDTHATHQDWTDAATDYVLMYRVPFHEMPTEGQTWVGDITLAPWDYHFKFAVPTLTQTYVENKFATEATTLGGLLNHAVDVARSYYTPLYAARLHRDQKAFTAIARDDNTILFSNTNGDGNVEDDNFPDLTTDTAGNRLTLALRSGGTMLGLDYSGDRLVALKQSEIEMYDMVSDQQENRLADVYASRSIIRTEKGLVWGGLGGIYLLPASGGEITLINREWQNLYDGRLKIATATGEEMSTTPYVTDAYRRSMLAGYNPMFREVWFHLQVNKDVSGSEYVSYRFPMDGSGWSVRELYGAASIPIKWFATRNDNTMTIGYAAGILVYPYRAAALEHEDFVSSTGVTAGYSVPTDQTLHIGSISKLGLRTMLVQLDLDWLGVATNTTDKFNLDLYANRDASPWEQLTIPMGTSSSISKTRRILVKARGGIKRLKIRMYLSGTLTNFSKWALSTMALWVKPDEYQGNR